MPKVELHLHLEGAVRPATLLALAKRNNITLPATTTADLHQLCQYHTLQQFLDVFMALTRALRRGEDFAQVACELGEDLAAQHVCYAEIMLSPSQHYRRGLDLDEVIQGALAGFAQAHRQYGIQMGLVLDYGRQFGTDEAWRILEVAQRYQGNGLVGWSIGGNELDHPPELYADVFAAARRAGFHVMAHAGEVGGSASIWGAIDVLGAERIGHGISAINDPALLAALRQRGIALDVCPASNVQIGVVPSLEQHPFRALFDAGVPVTLNTDDPTLFNTTLSAEYRAAARAFRLGAADFATLTLYGARAAFLPYEQKQALVQQLHGELHHLQATLGL